MPNYCCPAPKSTRRYTAEAHWQCGYNHSHQVFYAWSSNVVGTFHKKRTGMCGCKRATTQTKGPCGTRQKEPSSNHHHLEHAKYRYHQPNKVEPCTIQIKSKRPAFQADTFVVVQKINSHHANVCQSESNMQLPIVSQTALKILTCHPKAHHPDQDQSTQLAKLAP